MEYRLDEGACIPQRVHTVVMSVQHAEDISLEEMQAQLKEKIVKVREGGREGGREGVGQEGGRREGGRRQAGGMRD